MLIICIILLGIIVWWVYNWIIWPALEPRRKEEKRRFENGEMTADERAKYVEKQLKSVEKLYNHGDLTLFEREVLKKKYTGKSMLIDNGGLEFTAAASNKVQAERAITQHQKKAERDLIFQASVGSAINGTAGAIIGAANSAQKSSGEAAALESQRVTAEQKYRKALDDLAKP